MVNSFRLFSAEIDTKNVLKRMAFGALIGFVAISLLVFGVDDPDPSWPANWKVKPLVVTPLVTAFGMLSFYLKDIVGVKGDWPKIFLFFASAILFLISLWLGTVLGLNGTLWN